MRFVCLIGLAVLLSACPGRSPTPGDGGLDGTGTDVPLTGETGDVTSPDAPDAPYGGPTLANGCDPIVPQKCGYPYPSDTWRLADTTAPGGYRIHFGPNTITPARNGMTTSPDVLGAFDGFSAGTPILAYLPGATTTGLPDSVHIADSLNADSPTVIIEADTGVHVAHFSEIDQHANSPTTRAFMIRAAQRLKDHTRYIVAIRNVVDTSGAAIAPSDAFRALRDGTAFPEPSIDARRAHYESLFSTLATAGVQRASLQLAWDFTTAGQTANVGGMLQMRDTSLAALPVGGPPYVVDMVTQDVDANIATRIDGHVTVPLYLDQPGPGGRMVRDASGNPMQHGTTTYPFLVLIPRSVATMGPAHLVQFGHGLFLDRTAALTFGDLANRHNYVLVSMDWIGMSANDPAAIAAAIQTGDLAEFNTLPDRSQQGFLNMLLAMRMMLGSFVNDPAVQVNGHPAYLTTDPWYFGGSLGGIYGTSYMALTQDIHRGVLAVPGQPFSLLLPRSVLFSQFEVLLDSTLRDGLDVMLYLALVQTLWDRAEPDGYSAYVTSNPLPNTPVHQVLMLSSLGDHQVTNVGTHNLARTMGLENLQPSNESIFGVSPVISPSTVNTLIEFDFGLPPIPVGDEPATAGADPHSAIHGVIPAELMGDEFYRTGTVTMACMDTCNPD